MEVLIFGAHPDDPKSGCGGLIANAVSAGHEAHCLFATAFREGRTFFGRAEAYVKVERGGKSLRLLPRMVH